MKMVVTGGAGFIGTHLVHRLVEAGHEVHVVDNLSKTGTYAYESSNLVHFHQLDIVIDRGRLEEVFKDAKFVFHMAALTSVPESLEDPVKYHDNNVFGTLNVLEAASKAGVGKVIFSSSSAVYGEPKTFPTNEADVTEPMSPYALDKLMGEELCLMYARAYGLGTASLRYFNVYGEGMNESGAYAPAIAIFLKQLREGKTLTVTGDGLQTRDFVHVSDVVDANIKLAYSSYSDGHIFNCGSGEEVTINEVAKMISEDIDHIEARQEPLRSVADIDAIGDMLSWEPNAILKEEIATLKSKVIVQQS
jgi:UDP-glucose 4-epimerase